MEYIDIARQVDKQTNGREILTITIKRRRSRTACSNGECAFWALLNLELLYGGLEQPTANFPDVRIDPFTRS